MKEKFLLLMILAFCVPVQAMKKGGAGSVMNMTQKETKEERKARLAVRKQKRMEKEEVWHISDTVIDPKKLERSLVRPKNFEDIFFKIQLFASMISSETDFALIDKNKYMGQISVNGFIFLNKIEKKTQGKGLSLLCRTVIDSILLKNVGTMQKALPLFLHSKGIQRTSLFDELVKAHIHQNNPDWPGALADVMQCFALVHKLLSYDFLYQKNRVKTLHLQEALTVAQSSGADTSKDRLIILNFFDSVFIDLQEATNNALGRPLDMNSGPFGRAMDEWPTRHPMQPRDFVMQDNWYENMLENLYMPDIGGMPDGVMTNDHWVRFCANLEKTRQWIIRSLCEGPMDDTWIQPMRDLHEDCWNVMEVCTLHAAIYYVNEWGKRWIKPVKNFGKRDPWVVKLLDYSCEPAAMQTLRNFSTWLRMTFDNIDALLQTKCSFDTVRRHGQAGSLMQKNIWLLPEQHPDMLTKPMGVHCLMYSMGQSVYEVKQIVSPQDSVFEMETLSKALHKTEPSLSALSLSVIKEEEKEGDI